MSKQKSFYISRNKIRKYNLTAKSKGYQIYDYDLFHTNKIKTTIMEVLLMLILVLAVYILGVVHMARFLL